MKKLNKYRKIFKNKKILITGHTGFKGSWLSAIFTLFGAKIYGISNGYPTKPSLFKMMQFQNIRSYFFDLSNLNKLKKTFNEIKPDYVFHMAAQTIVKKSYTHPIETWNSNLNSTLNILEVLRTYKNKCNAVLITSVKCYQNIEKKNGYVENDRLGGDENYSASKAACEILFRSYFISFFKNQKKIRLSTVRAGNVIGGGDWAENRIVPDIFRSLENNDTLVIRYPNATRPWQHVVEPLMGYIDLSVKLKLNNKLSGESFNFGPYKSNYSVLEILKIVKKNINYFKWKIEKPKKIKETMLLQLNCQKALKKILWKSKFTFKETITETIFWYQNYKKIGCKDITNSQIKSYLSRL